MVDNAALTELFTRFIADETAALAANEQGSFYPDNHHRIRPALGKISACLKPEDRTRVYFHFMRVGGGLPGVSEPDFPHLVAAYRELLPYIDRGWPINRADRLGLLFCFGFDDAGELPGGATGTAADFTARAKLLTQIGRYSNFPGLLKKADTLKPFVSAAPVVLETLRHLGYRHSGKDDDRYVLPNLDFWGLVVLALQAEAVWTDLLRDFLDGGFTIPKRDEHAALLGKAVEGVLPACGPGEAAFLALAGRLTGAEVKRRETTESAAFVRALGLPFADGEEWRIEIRLPEDGTSAPLQAGATAMEMDLLKPGRALFPPNLILEITSHPDFQWNIHTYNDARGRFAEWSGRVSQNDLGIDGLGQGNLAAFPAWLRTTREKFGLAYRVDLAIISCGRKRSAIKLLDQWLAS